MDALEALARAHRRERRAAAAASGTEAGNGHAPDSDSPSDDEAAASQLAEQVRMGWDRGVRFSSDEESLRFLCLYDWPWQMVLRLVG